jgi:hypothetical protein
MPATNLLFWFERKVDRSMVAIVAVDAQDSRNRLIDWNRGIYPITSYVAVGYPTELQPGVIAEIAIPSPQLNQTMARRSGC